jgi:hypothetical protein
MNGTQQHLPGLMRHINNNNQIATKDIKNACQEGKGELLKLFSGNGRNFVQQQKCNLKRQRDMK